MNTLALLRERFAAALDSFGADTAELLEMIRPSQDSRHGDYQANCAMPLGNRLERKPRDIAAEIVERLEVDDCCQRPEIAGPGFINLRLKDDWMAEQLDQALVDHQCLGIASVSNARSFVVDYSAPNVAKPMHVGHIRSTVIGDSLCRTLKFLGHRVISDNHIGDWGTQFGMILFGYKHFLDEAAYCDSPVEELGRLYRTVNTLVEYHQSKQEKLPEIERQIAEQTSAVQQMQAASDQAPEDKKAAKAVRRAQGKQKDLEAELRSTKKKIAQVEDDPQLAKLAEAYPNIGRQVLEETARLHSGDPENRKLWEEFLPPCLEAIGDVYRRLNVEFDETLGESFYHDRLPAVVDELKAAEIGTESEGAICVFLEGFDSPMIVQKKDGAFLYATTDLATIQYRMERFDPASILYVVDHRQSLHFEQLFATARRWGYDEIELTHVSFGTVLGEDGRPFKTRSGDAVGLNSLLDEAVRRAHTIVAETDDAKDEAELSDERRREIAEVVGIGALKYADLAHNRTSDYKFSFDKMLAMTGNTATYMQYAYARVRSIFRKGEIDSESLANQPGEIDLSTPEERELALQLLRLPEALDSVVAEYRPNHLTDYLFQLGGCYSRFFVQCPVLRAPTEELRISRLKLCDLTARTLKLGLNLLGIDVVEKM